MSSSFQFNFSSKSHIVDRVMVKRIFSVGLIFFVLLAALWQLMWHKEIHSVQDILQPDTLKVLISDMFSMARVKEHIGTRELSIFFSIFVMLQFWNLFNAKYFKTNRSLIQDVIDLFHRPQVVREAHSKGFWMITLLILVGQFLIVSYGGKMFSVERLTFADWGWILLITSPVLIVADIYRYISNLGNK